MSRFFRRPKRAPRFLQSFDDFGAHVPPLARDEYLPWHYHTPLIV